MKKHRQGFTLVELVIAMAIVAILGAIAYPSYRDHVMKVTRADAKTALTGFASALERYRVNNNSYADADTVTIYPMSAPDASATPSYVLSISITGGGAGYLIEATPKNAQAKDKCGAFTLSQSGVRGLKGNDASMTVDDCWR